MFRKIDLGFIRFSPYVPLFLIGFAISAVMVMFIGKRVGLTKKNILLAGLFGLTGLVIGGKLFYMFTRLSDVLGDIEGFSKQLSNDLSGALDTLFGGMVFYGGLIGFCFGIVLFCRKFYFDRLVFLDLCAPFFPLAHAFGRLGCFCEGCCYGIEYHGIFSITYPYNELNPELSAVPRFPVQLVEAGFNLVCFTVLFLILYKELKRGSGEKKLIPGQLLGIYLICYIAARTILEIFRGDAIRGKLGIFSTSQIIGFMLLPIAIWLVNRKRKVS